MQNYTLEVLKKYNIKPLKNLGQNFLIDNNVLNKIVSIYDLKNEEVVEIGPGLGSLTNVLLDNSKGVEVFEIDSRAIEILNNELGSNEKLKINEMDFLKYTPSHKDKKIIISNIPYYITSDIIFKIIMDQEYYKSATLMIQEEVADRIISKPKMSNYGKLSVSIQSFAEVRKEFQVKPSCFFPEPGVNSAVITMTINPKIELEQMDNYLLFIKRCFSQQRKTLVNNLKNFYESKVIIDWLTKNNKELNVRPQQISINEFINLFNVVK